MDNHELSRLQDTLARRPLTAEERERLERLLAGRPDLAADWEAECALAGLLARLSDVPLASNFTAQVLGAIEPPSPHRPRSFWRWVGVGHPALRFAGLAACLVVMFAGLWLRQSLTRAHMASSVAGVVRSVDAASTLAQLPPVEVFQDFEAIHRLGQTSIRADLELLDALAVN